MRIGISYLCEITDGVVEFIEDLRSGDVGLRGVDGFEIQTEVESNESSAETYFAEGKVDGVEFDLYVLKTGTELHGLRYVVSGYLNIFGVDCRLEDIIFAKESKKYVLSDLSGELHCGMIVAKKEEKHEERV